MEPHAFLRVVEVPFQGEALKFIGPEDFIAMKVFAGGPMDLIDAARAMPLAPWQTPTIDTGTRPFAQTRAR
jgi:hypothetical protein